MTRRGQHWTDTRVGPRLARRTISNWCNYRTPRHSWRPSDPRVELATGVPDDWEGQFDFRHHSLRGPAQVFFDDATDSANRAMIGLRRADRPGAWFNLKWLGVRPSVAPQVSARSARWDELYDGTDVAYDLSGSGFKERLTLRPGHPASFRFALRIPDRLSHELLAGGTIVLRDEAGAEVIRLLAPWGRDTEDRGVRVAVAEGPPITVGPRTFPTFRLVPDPEDLGGAVYPVEIDPTALIGAADIEDNSIFSGVYVSHNYGGWPFASTGVWTSQFLGRHIMRINPDTIPNGIITGFRHKFYQVPDSPFTDNGGILDYYAIKDANDWVEGTATVPQTGSSCWNAAKLDAQNWAGHPTLGCGVSGTDYHADFSPPNIAFAGAPDWHTPITATLDPQWPIDWRAGPGEGGMVSNGVMIRTRVEGPINSACKWRSTEYADPDFRPSFEVDYAVPSPVIIFGGRRS